MTKWNKLLLGKQAKELGFVRDTYEKVCRLTEILTEQRLEIFMIFIT